MAISGKFGSPQFRPGKGRLAALDATAIYVAGANLHINIAVTSPTGSGGGGFITPPTTSGQLGATQGRLGLFQLGGAQGNAGGGGGGGLPFTASVSASLHLNVGLLPTKNAALNKSATLNLDVSPSADLNLVPVDATIGVDFSLSASQVHIGITNPAAVHVDVRLSAISHLAETDEEDVQLLTARVTLSASAILFQILGLGQLNSNFTLTSSAAKTANRTSGLATNVSLAAVPFINHAWNKSPSLTDYFGFTPNISLTATVVAETIWYQSVDVTSYFGLGLKVGLAASAQLVQVINTVPTLNTHVALRATQVTTHTYGGSSPLSLSLGLQAAAAGTLNRSLTENLNVAVSAVAIRERHGAATLNLNVAPGTGSNHHYSKTSELDAGFTLTSTAAIGYHESDFSLGFELQATATIILATGGGVPGGDQDHSLRTVLINHLSPFPNSYCETPPGLLMIANGIDPMVRWDGLAAVASFAGISPPATGCNVGGVGVGSITGTYNAFVRYLDSKRQPSNLSPISNTVTMGFARLIQGVTYDSNGVVTVLCQSHNLAVSDQIIISGVQGLALANGTFTVATVAQDTFTLAGLVITSGSYQKGGSFALGVAQVVYSDVPIPTDDRVAIRQILRNTDRNADTYYVDIETTDLSATMFVSSSDDTTLAAGEAVPLFDDNDEPFANRYSVPPSHKAVVVSHQGRLFAGAEVSYTVGNVQLTFGSTQVKGIGTAWPSSLANRLIYPVGSSSSYQILSVDSTNQVLTLTMPCQEPTQLFVPYAIRPAPGERRLVYFSEAGQPESWPEWYAFGCPEDSDEIVSLMVKDAFLYVIERRHIRKFTFHAQPQQDGFLFPSVQRGCINHRCWVLVEDAAYMLDEAGIHSYDGGQSSTQLSGPIQNLFQHVGIRNELTINWAADQSLWHAAHDPIKEVIRWFVTLSGSKLPRHAICYEYRAGRFWIEEYPVPITSSAIGTIGYRRSLAGSAARRVLCLGEGSTECVEPGAALQGTVTGATPCSLLDATDPFPANLSGSPVSIVAGRGQGQQRLIVDNAAGYLSVDQPWLILPDTSSIYQIGGIDWTWQSGWFRYAPDTMESPRDVDLAFNPLVAPTILNVQLYFDHSLEPRLWNLAASNDGVTSKGLNSRIAINLETTRGYAMQRLAGHNEQYSIGDKFVSVGMSGTQAGDIVRVFQVGLAGAGTEASLET